MKTHLNRHLNSKLQVVWSNWENIVLQMHVRWNRNGISTITHGLIQKFHSFKVKAEAEGNVSFLKPNVELYTMTEFMLVSFTRINKSFVNYIFFKYYDKPKLLKYDLLYIVHVLIYDLLYTHHLSLL